MTDDYRGQHQAAVAAAGEGIENLQATIAQAKDGLSELGGMVHNAVGDSQTDAAQSLRGVVDAVNQPLDEALRLLAIAIDELRRYGNGF